MMTKQLPANGAPLKESTHPRTDGAKSPLAKLPAPSPAPEKVRTINVCLKRDALALVQVTAATALPSHVNVTEQTKEVLVESAEALYEDFRTADPIDSILARLMCGISSMTMDSLSRGTWSQNLVQREMELKTATRGALVIAELTKAYDGRRTRGKQTVNVGQVNVGSGGQAVVGNVTSASLPGEIAHPASMPEKEMDVVDNATAEKRPEGATQGISPPQPKIEDSTPPQK
jgi:hypothetical protein